LKTKAMTVTQTYYLAHTARGKLSSEASQADHNLRLLVGHANLLDSLMLELTEAGQEQETWFNQSVNMATKPTEPRHIQWADTVVEDPDEDWRTGDADSSDSDSDSSDEEVELEEEMVSSHRAPSNNAIDESGDIRGEIIQQLRNGGSHGTASNGEGNDCGVVDHGKNGYIS
jgi:hypothetical protein